MKNTLLILAILCLCFSLPFQSSFAYTTINGGTASGTWTTGTTYYIIGTVTINDNTVLTIQQGCIIKFAANAELYVYGSVDCNGAVGNPVIFTSKNDNTYGETIEGSSGSPAAGDWLGLYFYGASDYDGIGYLDYCRVRYAGNTSTGYDAQIYFYKSDGCNFTNSICEFSANDGIYIFTSSPSISGSTFSNCVRFGLYCSGDYVDATAPTVTNCIFNNNGSYAAFMTNLLITSYSGNTGAGNGMNGLGVQGEVKSNQAWSCGSSTFPFILLGTLQINDNFVLTLNAGTIIKAGYLNGQYGEIYCYGTLDVNGTSGSAVVITSIKDDTFGGDTNADGELTAPAPGDWKGIYFYGNSDYDGYGSFSYTRIRYGGNTGTSYDANLAYYRADNASDFTNSISEYSGQDGIYIWVTSPNINSSVMSYNTRFGLYSGGDYPDGTYPRITDNSFTNNGNYAAYIENTRIMSYSGNTGTGNGINGIGVKGFVTSNEAWTAGATTFPFILTGEVVVRNNWVLTINEPSVIKAAIGSQFLVYGTLSAVGSAKGQIVFTSLKDDNYGGNTDGDNGAPAPGDWLGIYLLGSYSSGYDGIGNFNYCIVRFGGSSSTSYDANIYYNSSKGGYFTNSVSEYSANYGINITVAYPNVGNSFFRYNGNHGLYAHDQFTEPTVNNNTFNNNGGYGALISATTLQSYSGNTGTGNVVNGLGLSGSVAGNKSWSSTSSFPLILTSAVTVNDNFILTINEGTVIKSQSSGELIIRGTLDMNGTAENNIVFTSIKDDGYAGDTNGDGVSSAPAPGDWRGVVLYASSGDDGVGYFDYCKVRYGGNTATSYMANVSFNSGSWDNGSYFRNGVCEFSQGYGIKIYEETVTISGSSISNNTLDGIYASASYGPSTAPYITNNIFNNNGGFGANLLNIRPTSYSGNTGSGNNNNAIGVYGVIEDTPINWNSGSNDFPISLTGTLTINSGKNLSITSGTLRCNNNNITSSGNFSLNSGATIEIGSANGITSSGTSGNVQNSGSRTFSTGANYVYNGSTSQVTGSGLPSTVNKLRCSNSAGLTLTSDVIVNSELNINQGLINNSSKSLSVANAGKIIVDQGSLSVAPVFLGNVNMEYTGINPGTTGNELPSANIITDFTLNKVGGLTLDRDIRVNGNLGLQSGNLNTGSCILTLGSSVDNLGNLTVGMGKVIGNFKRWFAPSTVNNVMLPIGTTNNKRYSYISFTSAPSTGGTLTASFIESDPGENGLPLNNDGGEDILKITPDGYWSVNSGDGLSGGTYNIDLWGEGLNGISDYTKLHLVKRANGSSPWVLQGSHLVCSGTNSAPMVHRTGLTGFSEFGIGSTLNNPLPVELQSVVLISTGNIVTIKWVTATEINNFGFYLERRNGKKNEIQQWNEISFIPGCGNSNSIKEYSFTDKVFSEGFYCYRLKQVDNNGEFGYSEIYEVRVEDIPKSFNLSQNYPNPFNPVTSIDYQIPVKCNVKISLFNVEGNEIMVLQNKEMEPGYHSIHFNADGLSSGCYFYTINAGEYNKTKKMLLLK